MKIIKADLFQDPAGPLKRGWVCVPSLKLEDIIKGADMPLAVLKTKKLEKPCLGKSLSCSLLLEL